jgi:hypothetical protein
MTKNLELKLTIGGQTCPHCGCSGQMRDSLKCDDCGKNLPAAKPPNGHKLECVKLADQMQKQITNAKPRFGRAAAAAAMLHLRDFIGKSQLACVASGMRGEERQYFYDKMVELAALIKAMPHTYQQDGLGENAIVSLHYFTRGCDWFITEKDMGCADDLPERAPGCAAQHQAFGWADLGDRQCAELGYISIVELLACGAELDFHFKPKTLAQAKKEKYGDDN